MCIKKVYLTIDDGPSKDFRDKVDFLYQKGIPSIFFCIGKNIIKHEQDIIYAIKKGFIIGNHSFSHSYFSDISLDECKHEIRKTDEIIERLYIESEITRPAKFFRFPYLDGGGDSNSEEYEGKWSKPQSEWLIYKNNDKRLAIQAFLKELGYIQPNFKGININYVIDNHYLDGYDVRCTFNQMEYWFNAESAPWGLNKEEAILARIDEDFPEEGRALNFLGTTDIIMVHDEEITTELFYKIINRYIEKGISIISAL